MDIAAILAQAALQAKTASDAKKVVEIPNKGIALVGPISDAIAQVAREKRESSTVTPTELCLCGHEQHEYDCEVDGCDCTSYLPPSVHAALTVADVSILPTNGVSSVREEAVLPAVKPVQPPTLTVNIPPSPEVPIQEIIDQNSGHGSEDITAVAGEDGCAHLCEKCTKWFSHGPKNKCRFPDLLKQGLCMECLNGTANPDPLDDMEEDERGRKNLTPSTQVRVRNDERIVCKDMTIEQLSHHIEFIYRKELELRARGMEARKMRADLIEEQVENVPEEDREKFRAALLAGKQVKKEKKEKKETDAQKINRLTLELGASGCQMANLVAKWMVKTGKTRAEVEAMLND